MFLNTVASYFEDLTATSNIVSEFGSTFTFGSNLFIWFEPENEGITLYSYEGQPPDKDTYKKYPRLQVSLKTDNRNKTLSTMTAIINDLHNKSIGNATYLKAINSAPIFLDSPYIDKVLCVSNYKIFLK